MIFCEWLGELLTCSVRQIHCVEANVLFPVNANFTECSMKWLTNEFAEFVPINYANVRSHHFLKSFFVVENALNSFENIVAEVSSMFAGCKNYIDIIIVIICRN
jgi:hypothetical protein